MHMSSVGRVLSVASCLLLTGLASSLRAETQGPVTDPAGVVVIPKGKPILIGAYTSQSGPDSSQGIDEERGMDIAFSEASGKAAGHTIKLISEDSQCAAEGGQAAASKLVIDTGIVVALGPSCSSVARAALPILWSAKIPSIATGASNPGLTAKDRPESFAGFSRVVPNDNIAGAFAAKFAYEGLGARKVATLHDGTPYSQGLVSVFEAEFKRLGGRIVAAEAVSPSDTDMRPVLTQIGTAAPDVLYAPLYIQGVAYIARQSKEVAAMGNVKIVSGEAPFTPAFLTAAGSAATGISLVSVSTDAFSNLYPTFIDKYKSANGEVPTSGYAAYGYDSALLALHAINAAAKTDSDGTTYIGRQALLDAIHATKNLPGLTGALTCDPQGDCGASSYVAMQFTSGDPNSYSLGTNPKKVFP